MSVVRGKSFTESTVATTFSQKLTWLLGLQSDSIDYESMIRFPAVEFADESGLLALGGDLRVETLLTAYTSGIFPWPIQGIDDVPWFAPPKRGVLLFHDLHYPRSFKKFVRRHNYTLKQNTCFDEVIYNCAVAPRRQKGTWITKAMQDAYIDLHYFGFAHSIECFSESNLIAGLYGVSIGGYFAAESMFYKEPNSSKLCLAHLIEHLTRQGVTWIDCQQCTPLIASFGGQEISRAEFMKLLSLAVASPALTFERP